mmetsp:Transcript_105606/g.235785  ORF Transcript_105606/g.235785 Transcript_105606/m.235785 type:complete len:264 (+) Transcript_105606:333-1124(+)
MVDEGHARLVVDRGEVGLCSRQADGVGDAHAQRSRGHLDASRLEVLRMSRRLRAPLPKLFDIFNGDAGVACEVEQRVLEHATMARGQDESVAIHPFGVFRVEVHLLCEEHIADWRLPHGCSRVSAVGLVHGIYGKKADRVHTIGVHFRSYRRGLCSNAWAAAQAATQSRGSCKYNGASRAGCQAGPRALRGLLHARIGARRLGGARRRRCSGEPGDRAQEGSHGWDQSNRSARRQQQGTQSTASILLRKAPHFGILRKIAQAS